MNENTIKLFVCTVMLFLLAAGSPVQAEESLVQKTSIHLQATYASQYMWRGFDLQNGDPAFQSDVTFNFGDTGFYAGLWYSAAVKSRELWGKWDEIDGYFGYSHAVFPDRKYSLDYDIAFTHYYFPRLTRMVDTEDIMLSVKLPNALRLGGSHLVPRVKTYYGWSPHYSSLHGLWFAVAAMYDFPLPSLVNSKGDRKLSWILESYHSDGGQIYGVKAGWVNITTGFSTVVEWNGFQVTPAINYQVSLEDTVDKENEFWVMFSIGRDIR